MTGAPKFHPGQCLATPAAIETLRAAGQSPRFFLERFVRGDWGHCDEYDRRANDAALIDGGRLLASYRTLLGEDIWIIAEAVDDEGRREATTILLPSEY